MTSPLCVRLAVLAVWSSLCMAASHMEFSSVPRAVTTGVTKSVQLHCAINVTEDAVKRAEYSPEDLASVISLSVANKDGKTVATVHGGGAHVLVTKGGLTAEGALAGPAHLTLTFANPDEMDTGVYKCQMLGFSTNHHSINLERTWNVKTAQPLISDVLTLMKNEVAKLKQENRQQVSQLNNEVAQLKEQNSQQQRKIDAQTEITAKQTACLSTRVAFTARLRKNIVYNKNAHVKYQDVVENIHNDYNSGTSVFHCSEPGIYEFNLHIVTQWDRYGHLRIVHNGRRVTDVGTGSKQGGIFSGSTSAVIHLEKGDWVKVQTFGKSTLAESDHDTFQGNSFSGHLVTSDKCLP